MIIARFFFACNSPESSESEFYSPESSINFIPSNNDFSSKEKKIYSNDETDDITTNENTKNNTQNITKKIIKTASINFGVSDYKKSKENISKIISKHKGYVSSENESNTSYSISNTIIIRVPAENFETLLSDLEGEAKDFESKSINTNDVTEEFVDITTRLKNKKKVEAQYIELLKKAKTIAEILEVNKILTKSSWFKYNNFVYT